MRGKKAKMLRKLVASHPEMPAVGQKNSRRTFQGTISFPKGSRQWAYRQLKRMAQSWRGVVVHGRAA